MSDPVSDCSTDVMVLAPMASELRPVVRATGGHRSLAGGGVVYRGRMGGVAVTAAMIGVGPRAAADATRRLLEAVSARRVVVSGIAGGIDPAIEVGTVVVPETVLDLATGREFRPALLAGLPSSGTIATSGELILDDERVAALIERGVRAIDMETAGVAEVCEERGVPWSVVRVVSDRPQDGLVDHAVFDMLKPDGTTDASAALRYVATHPWRLPRLMRLARDSTAAAKLAARTALGRARPHRRVMTRPVRPAAVTGRWVRTAHADAWQEEGRLRRYGRLRRPAGGYPGHRGRDSAVAVEPRGRGPGVPRLGAASIPMSETRQ